MNRNFWVAVGSLAGGLVLLLLGGWRFGVHPQSVACASELAQKQDLEQQLKTARETAAQFEQFKAQAAAMRLNLDFYRGRTDGFLDAVMVSRMISGLGKFEALRDWTITVTPQAPKAAAGTAMGQYLVHVTFDSDYEHLGDFLNDCVSQRRLVVPQSVTLKPYADFSGLYYDTVSVDLTLMVYGGLQGKAAGRG